MDFRQIPIDRASRFVKLEIYIKEHGLSDVETANFDAFAKFILSFEKKFVMSEWWVAVGVPYVFYVPTVMIQQTQQRKDIMAHNYRYYEFKRAELPFTLYRPQPKNEGEAIFTDSVNKASEKRGFPKTKE